ncbi:MAG: hypothetical protein Q8920_08800 [Bacillota bacterium]|nr:hypothetical protein [Bacillota bacterium]
MQGYKRFCSIIIAISLIALLAGCGSNSSTSTPKTAAAVNTLNKAENTAAVKIINDYFKKLYTVQPDNSINAGIPSEIQDMVSKETLDLSGGSAGLLINKPRFVDINGMTAVNYEMSDVQASCVGSRSDKFVFFAEVTLKAKCLPDGVFDSAYKVNNATGAYEVTGSYSSSQMDTIKLKADYDVEVKKEGNAYKIVSAREAGQIQDDKARLSKYNNNFVDRLQYLDAANKTDNGVLTKETAVITQFFTDLAQALDKDKMDLLYPKWQSDSASFVNFLDSVYKPSGKNEKKLSDMMALYGDYKTKFDYASLLIQLNMEKVSNLSKFEITVHPAYSEKNKIYFVKFDADVEKVNGIIGDKSKYKYDYTVSLSGEGDNLKITGIGLNEFYNEDM